MAINQLKIVVSLLAEISNGNIPKAEDYSIDNEKFVNILEAMQDDGLIKGLKVIRGGVKNNVLSLNKDNIKITIKGMEYLNENSTIAKTYRGLKEIREWLPF